MQQVHKQVFVFYSHPQISATLESRHKQIFLQQYITIKIQEITDYLRYNCFLNKLMGVPDLKDVKKL